MNQPATLPAAAPLRYRRAVDRVARFRTPADPARLPEIRHWVLRCCRGWDLDPAAVECVHLALGEAVANAIRHGCAQDRSLAVEVWCALGDAELVLEVHDPGPGFDPDQVATAEVDRLVPGGLGLHLMRALMDEVQFTFRPGGTAVRMRKRVSAW
jgi:anti-sigma regulatory factor (Ser/Thr protein kinase)